MNESIPDLKIELMDDTEGSFILLEQDSGGNIDRVAIHQIHLRYMAEKFGLIETTDPQAQKTIATLQRRMVLLRDRIDKLHHYLVNHSDHKHADLSYEVTYATACIDLADEFCADFAGDDLTYSSDAEKNMEMVSMLPKKNGATAAPQASLI